MLRLDQFARARPRELLKSKPVLDRITRLFQYKDGRSFYGVDLIKGIKKQLPTGKVTFEPHEDKDFFPPIPFTKVRNDKRSNFDTHLPAPDYSEWIY